MFDQFHATVHVLEQLDEASFFQPLHEHLDDRE